MEVDQQKKTLKKMFKVMRLIFAVCISAQQRKLALTEGEAVRLKTHPNPAISSIARRIVDCLPRVLPAIGRGRDRQERLVLLTLRGQDDAR